MATCPVLQHVGLLVNFIISKDFTDRIKLAQVDDKELSALMEKSKDIK